MTYQLCRMLNSSQDIETVQVDAEIGLLLLGQNLENLPSSSSPIGIVVGEGLGEDYVNNLLSEK